MFSFRPTSVVNELITDDWAITESTLGAIQRMSSACIADPANMPCKEPPMLSCLIRWSKGFIITRKSEGDRTAPCFIPRPTGKGADREFSCFTQLVGVRYQALMMRQDLPFMPIENTLRSLFLAGT